MAKFIVETDYEGRNVQITMSEDDLPEFHDWMMAAEYLMCVTAGKSDAGFEKALELMCEGACTWRNKPWPKGKSRD